MGTSPNRRYAILSKEEFDSMDIDYSQVNENPNISDMENNGIRWDNNNEYCYLSYQGTKPDFLASITNILTNEEVLALMATEQWVSPDEDEV
tara:strand:+ start:1287 stop:1562 length:276 start_codon:yes stop_codon:yes gene_type:complete